MAALHSQMNPNWKLSPSESKEIVQARKDGESVTQLSVRFGVSRPTIYRAIEKYGSATGQQKAKKAVDRITVRLQPHEIDALDRLAAREKVSRAKLARRVLRLAADFVEPEPEILDAIRDLSRQIKMIGGNLNQIAAHLNREARMQGRASVSAGQWQQVESVERDMKAFVRQIDSLFLYASKQRRTRNADILKREGQL